MTSLDTLSEIYQMIADRIARSPGNQFLADLVEVISNTLGSDVTFVGLYDDTKSAIETQYLFQDGVFAENFIYPLAGTPCDGVLCEDACVIERDAMTLFPEDKALAEMGVVAYAGAPLIGNQGLPIGIIVTMKRSEFERPDIAVPLMQLFASRAAVLIERNKLISDLEVARAKAEAADRAKTRFLAMMSHELRTPLNAIIGYSDALRGGHLGVSLDHSVQEYIGEINQAGRHLLLLVDDLLDYSRVELDELEVDPTWFPLDDLVADVVNHTAADLVEKDLVLDRAIPEAASVRFDRRHLRQILINLLSQAIQHAPADSSMTISFQPETEAKGWLVLRASWTVPEPPTGSSPFEVETRPTGGPYVRPEAFGLGSAVIRALCKVNQERLEVETPPGEGTVRRISLPFRVVDGGDRQAVA
ncbi:MAG: GAF domain-containing sensor histidine kinase [Alphaproteobacteria bacterium]|nr:GAF domain-containing sensor histidine kinase [Alphaproteobacteria bacterium]